MAVAAIETQPVIIVPEMPEDMLTRIEAAHFIGNVLASHAAEVVPVPEAEPARHGSLMEAIHAAAEGDTEARRLIVTNVRTDAVERTIKAAHISEVELVVDSNGSITQFGQSMAAIQENALRYASGSEAMMRRSQAETRNSFRISSAYRQGLLDEYAFVVISRAADDMTEQEMDDTGFFTDTMSCAIQLTTLRGDMLVTESAFVAGKTAPDQPRHDKETVVSLGEKLGVNLGGKTATEIIDTPLLVHKSLLPYGVASIVAMYDEAAGGTFFGEAKPQQDYATYAQHCREREAHYDHRIERIVNRLITEAPTIATPVQATKRLHELTGAEMVEEAVINKQINPAVFGGVSAFSILQARHEFEQGNTKAAADHVVIAKKNDASKSCPNAVNGSQLAKSKPEGGSSEDSEKTTEKDEWVKMTCPICGDKNQYGWKCGDKHCSSCGSSVIKGKLTIRQPKVRKKVTANYAPAA